MTTTNNKISLDFLEPFSDDIIVNYLSQMIKNFPCEHWTALFHNNHKFQFLYVSLKFIRDHIDSWIGSGTLRNHLGDITQLTQLLLIFRNELSNDELENIQTIKLIIVILSNRENEFKDYRFVHIDPKP